MKRRTTRLNVPAKQARLSQSRSVKSPSNEVHGLSRLKVQHILVPTDFSTAARRALQYARPLAKRLRAELVLLHVVPPLVCPADYGYGPVLRRVPDENEVRAAMKHLRSIARRSREPSCCATSVVRSGAAPEEIIRAARCLKADLIVMGESAVKGSGKSTAEITIREAPCPVLVVRESGAKLVKPGKARL